MKFNVKTKGRGNIVDITGKVVEAILESGVEEGIALVFVLGSTAAITAIEYEDGVVKDLIGVLEKIAPAGDDYEHHKKWGDKNGDAHIKAGIIGPDFCVPIENNELALGTWQQIVLIDFDEKEREREIIIKVK